jgi:hypothetical protein
VRRIEWDVKEDLSFGEVGFRIIHSGYWDDDDHGFGSWDVLSCKFWSYPVCVERQVDEYIALPNSLFYFG